jgi:hypothetical protein
MNITKNMEYLRDIPNILVSVSGGESSMLMAKYIKDTVTDRKLHFVFSNTGKEREETLEFLNECDKRWNLNIVWIQPIAYHNERRSSGFEIIDFESADRIGRPFEEMIKKYGIPNKTRPHYTRELKIRPIQNYMKSIGLKKRDYFSAIGYRTDEMNRISWETAKKDLQWYPLVTEKMIPGQLGISKQDVQKWWDKQDFKLNLKSYQGNCDLCWKKSDNKIMTILLESPELLEWWNQMEIKYGTENNYKFYRGNKSILDLLQQMQDGNYRHVQDDRKKNESMLYFDSLEWEENCFCSI